MATVKRLLYVSVITTLINKCNGSACLPDDGIANGNVDTNSYNKFTFITRKEWKANSWRNDICSCNVSDTTEMRPLSEPYIITIHHTAEPTQSISTNDSIQKIQNIQNYHQYTHNWCDIGYNFLIDSAGNIFQGRPFWDDNETFVFPLNTTRKWPIPRLIQGSHSLNSNTNNIGIAVLGCYDSNIETCSNGSDIIRRYDITYTRLIQLISWLCDYYNINPSDNTIVRHSHWRNTSCPGNILGATQMFNDIITDVQMTVHQGTGLCFDYLTNIINITGSGGICTNAQLCDNNLIIDTGDEDQCSDLGQVCCFRSNDNGGDKAKKKDWGSIYIIIGIIVFLVLILIIAFVLKKRKEHLLAHSNFVDLTEDIPVQQETE